MTDIKNIALTQLGINLDTQWLLPNKNVPLENWAVIACDQFTSEPEYWNQVNVIIDRKPSTGHLIFPEVYLETQDEIKSPDRIEMIHKVMRQYPRLNIFDKIDGGVIIVRRKTSHGLIRHGIVAAIDLEHYEYEPGNRALIRASEATVPSRIPPRLAVRQKASLETSHVLLLANDPDHKVFQPFFEEITSSGSNYKVIYDTPLMTQAGHLTGWHVPADDPQLEAWLERLADTPLYRNHNLLFAVGDGNHSLATAKAHWDQLKENNPNIEEDHPARFAMVEIESLTDPGLEFEPIHQVIFDVEPDALETAAKDFYGDDLIIKHNVDCTIIQPFLQYAEKPTDTPHTVNIPVYFGRRTHLWQLQADTNELTIAALRRFLDPWIQKNNVRTDYIHGEEVVRQLCQDQANYGFLLPALDPQMFFTQIIEHDILPRKTFSLGHALDKRFYMECRAIALE
ncbi:MAG: DUF1015 domain-containing protein [Fastidiosipilaceae bacterium]|jgi:hypothetical protein|nr:DUF1015 domain-containing protein [Clostridiaceae bacterium]